MGQLESDAGRQRGEHLQLAGYSQRDAQLLQRQQFLGAGGASTSSTNSGSTTGTLNYTGTVNYTDTRVLTFSGLGGAINVATAGASGGKIVFSTANTITWVQADRSRSPDPAG